MNTTERADAVQMEKKRREAFIVDQDDDRPLTTVSRYINLYAGAGALPFKAEIQRAGNNN